MSLSHIFSTESHSMIPWVLFGKEWYEMITRFQILFFGNEPAYFAHLLQLTSNLILRDSSTVIPFLSLRDHVTVGSGEASNGISMRNFSPATTVTSRLRADESTLGLTMRAVFNYEWLGVGRIIHLTINHRNTMYKACLMKDKNNITNIYLRKISQPA